MRAIILACLLSVLGTAIGLYFLVHRPQAEAHTAAVAALEASNRGLQEGLQAFEKDRELHRVLLARKNASTARLEAARARLEADLAAALAQNPEWAAQAVPKEVQDALAAP